MTEVERLEATVQEYRGMLGRCENAGLISKRLAVEHDWTADGAEAVVRPVRDYGTFMLRNALALAVVLAVEDPPSPYGLVLPEGVLE
jgi:hypothetical protein